MKRGISKTLSATALSVGMLVAAGGVASATTTSPPTSNPAVVAALKAKCDAAIQERLTEITKLTAQINAAQSGHLLPADAQALLAILNGPLGTPGLQALKATIDQSGGDPNLKADCESIFTTYRIFALRVPQVHLVTVFDRETWAITTLDKVVTDIGNLLGSVKNAGADLDGAKAALASAQAQLNAASQALSPTSTSAILALTPTDWNNSHGAVLTPIITDVKSAHADIKSAGGFIRTAIADLLK